MFGLTAKKKDTQFGPPYAVFNLSKIGLRYFRIGIKASEHSRDRLVAQAAAHPNVGWIFSAEGWFNLAIGFWAKDNAEINDISTQVRAALMPGDTIVFQSELTSLYGFGDRASTGEGSPMCIVDATMHPVELAPLEVDYIKMLALDSSLSDGRVAEILGTEAATVADIKRRLTDTGVIVGYQSRIDYGKTYFKVFIDSLSRKKPDAVRELTEKLWADPKCIYFERANAKYDIECELILDSKSQLKEYLHHFGDYQAVVLTQNLYTNLFPLNKTANQKEIRDAFAHQEGDVVDLRESKLWYLNYQSAESYLNIYENRKYFEAMSKNELDLFGEVSAKVRERHPDDVFAVVDIGSGDGLKGRVFIEKLGEKTVKAYYPLDIQAIELAVALRAHEGTSYAKHPTLLPIEQMSARFPLHLLPKEQQVYLFLGGTYGNFQPSVINAYLKKVLSDTTTLVISMPVLRETKTDEEIIDSYTTAQIEAMTFGPLAQAGFSKEQCERNPRLSEFIVQPRMEDGRLVTTYALREPAVALGRTFNKGTTFKITTSWKPTFEQFKSAIETDFKAEFVRNKEFAIAIVSEARN